MKSREINEIKRLFNTRLETLDHILTVGEENCLEFDSAMNYQIAPDMFPLGTQIAFACNQPRAFARWCAGQAAENLDPNVKSLDVARSYINNTKALLHEVQVGDLRLDEIKRTDLGANLFCELPARLFVSDYLIPNFYFHISIAYAILRKHGFPLGKANYMSFLMPHVKLDN
jgi:uncharacterized protein